MDYVIKVNPATNSESEVERNADYGASSGSTADYLPSEHPWPKVGLIHLCYGDA